MTLICSQRFSTPLGPMYVSATDQGVCLLEFARAERIERESRDLEKRLRARTVLRENEHTRQAAREIAEYFQGTRHAFDIALHTPGTEFQRRVWAELVTIPFGHTTHYQAMAERLGRPDAVRAVAAAIGSNRVAVVIPCHRVIGKDGSLTGYAGGMQRKDWLLAHERGETTSDREPGLFDAEREPQIVPADNGWAG
jgi:methylated-DNA--[protein]-cysteine S-methyltransferase